MLCIYIYIYIYFSGVVGIGIVILKNCLFFSFPQRMVIYILYIYLSGVVGSDIVLKISVPKSVFFFS